MVAIQISHNSLVRSIDDNICYREKKLTYCKHQKQELSQLLRRTPLRSRLNLLLLDARVCIMTLLDDDNESCTSFRKKLDSQTRQG